jgi:diaminopimelate epimerase
MIRRARSNGLPFVKMEGLGNDFVILDGRKKPLDLTGDDARAIADRHLGIGCDQIITLQPSKRADVFMRIQNADGSETAACGNVTRCVAKILMNETGKRTAAIETLFDVLKVKASKGGEFAVDMGVPKLGWRDIPLAREMDTAKMDLEARFKGGKRFNGPVGVNIGNPHAIFFVDDVETLDIEHTGPKLEHDKLFPERANISFAEKTGPDTIRLRVWERGTGVTMACGSAACATLVAAKRRGLMDHEADIVLDGGTLHVDWRADGHVIMTGPAAESFRGTMDLAALKARQGA